MDEDGLRPFREGSSLACRHKPTVLNVLRFSKDSVQQRWNELWRTNELSSEARLCKELLSARIPSGFFAE